MIINRHFYNKDTTKVAQDLLGKILVHKHKGEVCSGKIVETEAYLGLNDKACHSYGGKITKRVESMYTKPGTAYVYLIYGMYHCMNVVTKEEEYPEAVLIRAIEPIEGLNIMSKRRFNTKYNKLKKKKVISLTNGPGKLCIAMNITRKNNEMDLCNSNLYIKDNKAIFDIGVSKRINIDYAEEAKDYPLRFYIKDNPYISK